MPPQGNRSALNHGARHSHAVVGGRMLLLAQIGARITGRMPTAILTFWSLTCLDVMADALDRLGHIMVQDHGEQQRKRYVD